MSSSIPGTHATTIGSHFLFGAALLGLIGCAADGHADPHAAPITTENHGAPDRIARAPAGLSAPAESALGIADRGIFGDLDSRVQLDPPRPDADSRIHLDIVASSARDDASDDHRPMAVLYLDDWPRKVYPLGPPSGAEAEPTADGGPWAAPLHIAGHALILRPGDRAELSALVRAAAPGSATVAWTSARARGQTRATRTAGPIHGDRDRDGVPDPLDLLIGGKKTVLNGAKYGAGYIAIPYPMGDVPRDIGVCTDVVIRAARNAGLDLQRAVHRDIRRARAAYPMVKGPGGNRNIDHRRVRTLLPYFKRHWDRRSRAIDDADDPLRPGDIVLMDTLPQSGPDHIGIVSDRIGASGHPLVINNWTNGFVTMEMDLLGTIPVTHRFRMPRARRR